MRNVNIQMLYRKILEESLIQSQIHADLMRFESAPNKYKRLCEMNPQVVLRASSISRCGGLGKEAYLPEKSDGLQRDFEIDGTARLQRLGNRQAHQRLSDGRSLLAAIQRRGNLRGHHARTSQKDHE